MNIIRIEKSDWDGGVEASRAGYRVIGPAPVPGKPYHAFQELAAGVAPDMSYKETRLSPKHVVFPQSEVLFSYSLNPEDPSYGQLQDAAPAIPATAVVGIRPTDAKALQLVKMNFDTPDYKDPYWIQAYEQSTFIGLADNTPRSTDFSTSCGTGPFDESGLDVLVVDMGDHYLAKVVTDKGSAWLSAAGFTAEAAADAASQIDAKKAAAEAAITSKVSFDKIGAKATLDLYNADFWETAAFGCINCGTCTYACPTCWCFDIQDENHGDTGVRIRNWDSCMTGLFTKHASGHNPREKGWERTRQRFMHKLKYFLDKYDQGIMCVGCGRCVEQCPANIDIRQICDLMNRA